MENKNSQFHMEAAGSLTPELEGAPASGAHQLPQRSRREVRGKKEAPPAGTPRDKGR